MITLDQVSKAVPAKLKNSITQTMVDNLNAISTDPLVAENIRENFMSYTGVLQEGRFKIDDYMNAIKFVSYRLMNYKNEDAYFRTFPNRHATLVAAGRSSKEISAYVSAYAKNKLVNLILEQSIIPSWVLNQDLYQKALNTQAEIMAYSNSDKVRSDAANSILVHLSKPKEASNFQLNIGAQESSGMNELRTALKDMALQQQSLIKSGVTPKEIAEARIIEGEIVDK